MSADRVNRMTFENRCHQLSAAKKSVFKSAKIPHRLSHHRRNSFINNVCMTFTIGTFSREPEMRAIKKVRLLIEQEPQDQTAQIFSHLILALVDEVDFSVKDLYLLNSSDFQLAMDILQEWRLDRYYMGKAKTFDVALQALSLTTTKS